LSWAGNDSNGLAALESLGQMKQFAELSVLFPNLDSLYMQIFGLPATVSKPQFFATGRVSTLILLSRLDIKKPEIVFRSGIKLYQK